MTDRVGPDASGAWREGYLTARHHGGSPDPRHGGPMGLHDHGHGHQYGPGGQGGHHRHAAPHRHPAAHAPRHHHHSGRSAHARLERGTVHSVSGGTAQVQLVGNLTRVVGPIPVSAGLPAIAAGQTCLVVFLDAHNPLDAVVMAAW